jgi:hypothetical protein
MSANRTLFCSLCGDRLVRFERIPGKPEVACLSCRACGDMREVEERSAGLMTGELNADQVSEIRRQMPKL